MRGWRNTVGNLNEFFCSETPITGLDLPIYARKKEGYGFNEFEISNNTISAVFRQPLSFRTQPEVLPAQARSGRTTGRSGGARRDDPLRLRRALLLHASALYMFRSGWGSDGNVYNVWRGLSGFSTHYVYSLTTVGSRARLGTRIICRGSDRLG